MIKTKNKWRKILQWSVITLMVLFATINAIHPAFHVDFEAYCPFGGLQSLGSYLLNEALSCTMTGVQIVMGISLIVAVLLFSKLFCAFICPIGTITEWLSNVGRKLKLQVKITTTLDLILRSLKYILLFITLFHTLQSNELFCKKFDPYYGITSGFDSDVVLWWSLTALGIVIVGSLFFRLFWCKYLCPLGAISNIFKFTAFFAGLMITYLLLLKLGVQLSYVWPLATACIGGYALELSRYYSQHFPLVKVTRNTDSCTHCSLCSRTCPQGIDVAQLRVVNDADCNLCGDCLNVCPEAQTLQFNHKKNLKYLPHIATIILVLLAMLVGQLWHIPTIDQRWYDFDAYEQVGTYERSGLSSVKCFGSSTAFANKMRTVEGILGVATYVDSQTAKIYYDASLLDEEAIERIIFTPQKIVLRKLDDNETHLTKVHVTLEDFFDKNDFNYLARFLQDHSHAVGMLSQYACPVVVEIFFPASENIAIDDLRALLETSSFQYTSNDKTYTATMGYEVIDGPSLSALTTKEYAQTMFVPVAFQFNNKADYTPDVLHDYSIASAINSNNRSRIKYLISHLSNDDGVLAFRNDLDTAHNERISITYVDSMTTIDEINSLLTSDTLYFNYKDGRQGKIINMFDFDLE